MLTLNGFRLRQAILGGHEHWHGARCRRSRFERWRCLGAHYAEIWSHAVAEKQRCGSLPVRPGHTELRQWCGVDGDWGRWRQWCGADARSSITCGSGRVGSRRACACSCRGRTGTRSVCACGCIAGNIVFGICEQLAKLNAERAGAVATMSTRHGCEAEHRTPHTYTGEARQLVQHMQNTHATHATHLPCACAHCMSMIELRAIAA